MRPRSAAFLLDEARADQADPGADEIETVRAEAVEDA
jgi:hypothetical protein